MGLLGENVRHCEDKCPVAEFLDSLPNKLGAKAIRDLDILLEKGNELREPYSKPIEGGIFELRISASRDEARIFYFFLIENKIILTNGIIKKTQKTPRKEVNRALEYKADYERRCLK